MGAIRGWELYGDVSAAGKGAKLGEGVGALQLLKLGSFSRFFKEFRNKTFDTRWR